MSETSVTKTETLLGGSEIEVKFADGKTELVTVLQLPIKSLNKWLACVDDDEKAVELYCNKPADWANTLTRKSFDAVFNLGESLNADFFASRVKRKLERQEKLMPGLTEKALASQIGSRK